MPKPKPQTRRETGSETASGFFCFSTAFGPMAIAWEGAKVTATHLPEKSEKALLMEVRRKLKSPGLEPSRNPPLFVKELAERVQRHLAGEPQRFPLGLLALERHSPFFRKVYEAAGRIPPGSVLTYGELAAKAGSPKAFRAVGQAMARNPFPLVIPCHRVVGSNRALVGFSARGGVATKSRLLDLEAHAGRAHHQS